MTDRRDPALDPDGHYAPADLVVSTDHTFPPTPIEASVELLPTREAIYRVVRERGPISLTDLAREVAGGSRAPYVDTPELYVLRLVVGPQRQLPPLCDLQTIVRALAEDPGPDPDYGFEVRPA